MLLGVLSLQQLNIPNSKITGHIPSEEKQIVVPAPEFHVAEATPEETKPVETPAPAPVPAPVQAPVSGIDSWIAQAGIASGDAEYVKYIVFKESSNNPLATNGQAYGLCQALPGVKMATAGSDWATNPVTQLRWCNGYAISRYGSWANAYNTWLSQHWW